MPNLRVKFTHKSKSKSKARTICMHQSILNINSINFPLVRGILADEKDTYIYIYIVILSKQALHMHP